jgi:hypothetical protein
MSLKISLSLTSSSGSIPSSDDLLPSGGPKQSSSELQKLIRNPWMLLISILLVLVYGFSTGYFFTFCIDSSNENTCGMATGVSGASSILLEVLFILCALYMIKYSTPETKCTDYSVLVMLLARFGVSLAFFLMFCVKCRYVNQNGECVVNGAVFLSFQFWQVTSFTALVYLCRSKKLSYIKVSDNDSVKREVVVSGSNNV